LEKTCLGAASPQIPHDINCAPNRTGAMGSRRLTNCLSYGTADEEVLLVTERHTTLRADHQGTAVTKYSNTKITGTTDNHRTYFKTFKSTLTGIPPAPL
jgi:hypothetical protein